MASQTIKAAADMSKDIDEEKISLVEEDLFVGKRTAVADRVRVNTLTDVTDHVVKGVLTSENIVIERKLIERFLDPSEEVLGVRTVGEVTIIPIYEEILVTEKRLFLKEEVHIVISESNKAVEIPVQLRKQRAVVERLDSEGAVITENPEIIP